MTKEQQDLVWRCLPKEARNNILSDYGYYLKRYEAVKANTSKGAIDALEDIFGRHNLTSDKELPELLFVERKKVQEMYIQSLEKSAEFNLPKDYCATYRVLTELFGDKCLPDKEPSVQGEPMRKVIFKDSYYKEELHGKVGIIRYMNEESECAVEVDNTIYWARESDLEPYTEPEYRNLSQNIANCDKSEDNQLKDMEEKELNLCELLIDYEFTGAMFYFALAGRDFELLEIKSSSIYINDPLNPQADTVVLFYNGKIYYDGITVLFPTKELYEKYPLDAYSAWMEWQSERTPKRWRAKQGEGYWYLDRRLISKECTADANSDFDRTNYENGNMFRTGELAQQAAEAVKECLMKFHEQNKK